MWKVEPLQILIAIGLDLILGDPKNWPHLTKVTGFLATAYERLTRNWFTQPLTSSPIPLPHLSPPLAKGRMGGVVKEEIPEAKERKGEIIAGAIFWLMICGTMLGGYFLISSALIYIHPKAVWIFQIMILYQTIAAMDLARHVHAVQKPLRNRKLQEARAKLSLIVGRDTANLNETEIARATIESVAESSNDGFVAPLFWTVIAGAPGALLYRVANTLDSIVGHRTPAYEYFGKASARMDDVLSWLPARICALLLALQNGLRHWSKIQKEAKNHASPNAGWSEAAMAYLLGVQLGGESSYNGQKVAGPIFNREGRNAGAHDIASSLRCFWYVIIFSSIIFLIVSVSLN